MKRALLRVSLVVGLALALGASLVVSADAIGSTVQKRIRITRLATKTQESLRKAGVTGPKLELAGTPDLAGSVVQGLSLYYAPWAKGGECVSGVIAGKPDGADCDQAMFTKAQPGYATAGPLGSTTTGTAAPGLLPPHTLKILQVYGVATTVVRSARLIGPKSGKTELPLTPGTSGFVVFGSPSPPEDGDFVELLNAAGKVVQRIQIAP